MSDEIDGALRGALSDDFFEGCQRYLVAASLSANTREHLSLFPNGSCQERVT
jgi:hypothetical protein